jgi:hypothetical protein
MGRERRSFLSVFVETELFMLSLLGWAVFWALMAVGASGGGDLGAASNSSRGFAFALTACVYAVCIVGPSLWPEHLPVLARSIALGVLSGTLVLGAVASVWLHRS